MRKPLVRVLFGLGVAACLAWAAVEARGLSHTDRGADGSESRPPEPAAVVESFRQILEAKEAGRKEEAVLALQERAEKGPYAAYAWFLLGEVAYEEGAFGAALHHYRSAVATDASVADRGAPFQARRFMVERLEYLRTSPWAATRPPELSDLGFLRRRLAGGCE